METTMPKEIIRNATTETGNQVEVGWHREAEFVQVATHDGTPEHGLYADLDRAALNRLIVALRRARDQAFGRDA